MDEEERKKMISGLVKELADTIYDVILESHRHPEVALLALNVIIGRLLHVTKSPLQIQDFLDDFPVQIKKNLGWKKENENVLKSSIKKNKPS